MDSDAGMLAVDRGRWMSVEIFGSAVAFGYVEDGQKGELLNDIDCAWLLARV